MGTAGLLCCLCVCILGSEYKNHLSEMYSITAGSILVKACLLEQISSLADKFLFRFIFSCVGCHFACLHWKLSVVVMK